jgi:protein-tyrosine-phosphatase
MSQEKPKAGPKEFLKRLLPDSWLKERNTFLLLGPRAGAIYGWLRLLDLGGVRLWSREMIQPSAREFLFVCFGNIMRSPMAEVMFRKFAAEANLPGVRALSAGLHAIPGREAHPRALTAAQELGFPLGQHRAQLLTPELVAQADAIFVMDFQNKAEVLALYPNAKKKILMLSAYADGAERCREIPDPYFGDLDATRRCYAILQTCIRNLTTDLAARTSGSVASVSS